jgi:hypothetical protein
MYNCRVEIIEGWHKGQVFGRMFPKRNFENYFDGTLTGFSSS